MATKDEPQQLRPDEPHRLSDYYQSTRNQDILASIEGQEVRVVSATVRSREGANGTYKMTTVELDDGRRFTVSGNRVADPMEVVPDDAYPILATFRAQPSAFDPEGVYWTVE